MHGSADLSLSTDIKSEKDDKVKYNNYGPSHSSSGTFLKQEPSSSSVAWDRPSIFYNGHSRDQFYEGNISDQFYNSPYDYQRAENDYCGVTSSDYQPYTMDYQLIIAQENMTQPASSYCHTSPGYSQTSPINVSYPQTTPENRFSTGWTSAAQGFNTPVQYEQQTMVDCSRPIRKCKKYLYFFMPDLCTCTKWTKSPPCEF